MISIDLFAPVIERIKQRIAQQEAAILGGQLQPQTYNYTVGIRHGLLQALDVIDTVLTESDE